MLEVLDGNFKDSSILIAKLAMTSQKEKKHLLNSLGLRSVTFVMDTEFSMYIVNISYFKCKN